jgi:hypothetical protein
MRNLPGLNPLVRTILNSYPNPTDESASCTRRTTAISTASWNLLPTAQKGAAVYSPTVPEGTLVGTCYVDASSSVTSQDAYRIKIDHNFNGKHSLMARFNSAPINSEIFSYANRTNQGGKTYTFTTGYKAVLSSRFVNELNFNWSKNSGS